MQMRRNRVHSASALKTAIIIEFSDHPYKGAKFWRFDYLLIEL